jgi:predicted CXXCH cytochrome family protein
LARPVDFAKPDIVRGDLVPCFVASGTERPEGDAMNRTTNSQLIVALVWLTLGALPVRADYAPGSGIVGSPHDFVNPGGRVYQPDPHATVCIFCHSQDSADKSAATDGSTALSWNHKLTEQAFFWSDSRLTEGGTPLPTNLTTWAGSSKYCLSCHDGTVSLGDVYHGNYPVTSFVGGAAYADGSGMVPNWRSNKPIPQCSGCGSSLVDATGRITARFRMGVAGDVRGTHPVGIPYPYQGAPGTYNGITTGSRVDLRDYVPAPANVKLFTAMGTEVSTGARVGSTGIECATCHDVHNEAARDRHLLRDTQRQLCLDCHDM